MGPISTPDQAREEILMKNSMRYKSPLGIEDPSNGIDLPEYFQFTEYTTSINVKLSQDLLIQKL
jgi:hypothetical protein